MFRKPVLILVLLSVLFMLTACSDMTPRTIGSDITIPEDGFISTEILKEIKDKNLVTVFKGTSDGYLYEWTVFGNELDKTEEINLKSDISINKNNRVEILLHGSDDPFHSVLSVHTELDLRGIHFDAYELINNKEVKHNGTVTVTGEEKSILNFSPGRLSGKYILIPDTKTSETTVKVSETSPAKKVPAVSVSETSNTIVSSQDKQDTDITFTDETEKNIPESSSEQSILTEQTDEINEETSSELKCTVLIECTTIFSNLSKLEPGIINAVPSNGIILERTETTFSEGESVFDVIKRLCKQNNIHLEFEHVPLYGSSYITAINNLYEFDCGSLSGWLYSVNGWFPNYGSSSYELKNNDIIEWRYSCDLGKDVNGGTAVNQNQ